MQSVLREIQDCEVCGSETLVSVLDLGNHPMCDDLVAIGESRVCREYPIEILYCQCCRTAHQRFQIPKKELFPATYHYRSRFTADVLSGMASLVESCASVVGDLAGRTVLDIGCNDGSLLDFFRKKGAKTVGIEPTGAYLDAQAKGHATYGEYLSGRVAEQVVEAHGKPDVITFTNVFAHIEDLRDVIASLQRLMSERTIIVIENHYLGAVLDGNQFDTFYHEHPRSYSYTSFVHMAASLGVALLAAEFPSRYGGNIRVFMGNQANASPLNPIDTAAIDLRENGFLQQFGALRGNIQRWRASKRAFLDHHMAEHGPMRAKAFPGRAAILVKMLDLDAKSVSAVYEKPGSLKIGNYLPGTRIPIRSDDELFALRDQKEPVLNLAWHIPKEIRDYLTAHGYQGEVVDVLSPSEFRAAS
ncbi:MAG: class I SAM-dependent methyltransferase [Pseudomonadota bacterium]